MNKSEISVENQTRINFAVKQAFSTDRWEPIILLSGGLTGVPIYKIEVNNHFYAIKLDDVNDKNFDLARCYKILESVAKRGIAPPVYFTDAASGVVIMKYIDPKQRPEPTPASIDQFGKLIHKLHHGEVFPNWRSLDEVLDYFYQKLTPEYQSTHFIMRTMQEAKQLQVQLSDPAEIKPSHGDLNPNNVLYDGEQLYLIDWPTAAPRSFYFDLACVANFFYFYNEGLCQQFLKSYFGRAPTKEEQEKYALMRKFTHIYFGIIFIALPIQANAGLPPLSDIEIDGLPMYLEFMQSIGSGKVNLSDAKTQQEFGYVFLKASQK